jgi:LPXTG-motif cell wall-anchored protein
MLTDSTMVMAAVPGFAGAGSADAGTTTTEKPTTTTVQPTTTTVQPTTTTTVQPTTTTAFGIVTRRKPTTSLSVIVPRRPADPPVAASAADRPAGGLPRTGGSSAQLAAAGGALVSVGSALWLADGGRAGSPVDPDGGKSQAWLPPRLARPLS